MITKKINQIIIIAICLVPLVAANVWAQSGTNRVDKQNRVKIYECNGQLVPYPCSKLKPSVTPTPQPTPKTTEDDIIRGEIEKDRAQQIKNQSKELYLRDLRHYANYMNQKYGVTSTELDATTAYCNLAETTPDNCQKKCSQISAKFYLYEKEYNKKHGINKIVKPRGSSLTPETFTTDYKF